MKSKENLEEPFLLFSLKCLCGQATEFATHPKQQQRKKEEESKQNVSSNF